MIVDVRTIRRDGISEGPVWDEKQYKRRNHAMGYTLKKFFLIEKKIHMPRIIEFRIFDGILIVDILKIPTTIKTNY